MAQTGLIQKGERRSVATEFKPGQAPWNKGVVYERILGEKHPQWKGGKPDCMDCGTKLKKYTSKRCSPCHLNSNDFQDAIQKARQANTGKVGHRLGAKLTDEQKARLSEAKKGQVAWNKGITAQDDSRILSGEANPAWKGGVTPKNRLERVRFQQTTQPLIFKRDNYTCQVCDQTGGYLQVDHIKGWSEYPELRFELDNCRTLCMACHYYVTFKRKIPKGIIWGHNLSRRIV